MTEPSRELLDNPQMTDPTQEERDEAFRQRVLRARAMSPGEKLAECFRLSQEERDRKRAAIRQEHPNANSEDVERILREQIDAERREEERGLYFPIDEPIDEPIE